MRSTVGEVMTCQCHSSDLYVTLEVCPQCRHRSLDTDDSGWRGCERRRCGFESWFVTPSPLGDFEIREGEYGPLVGS